MKNFCLQFCPTALENISGNPETPNPYFLIVNFKILIVMENYLQKYERLKTNSACLVESLPHDLHS